MQEGSEQPPRAACPRLGVRTQSPGVGTSSRAAARLLRKGHKSWQREQRTWRDATASGREGPRWLHQRMASEESL